jgi:hypothetical protein
VAKSYKSKDALPPRAAREAAARLLMELRTAPKEETGAAPMPVCTWAECVAARLQLLAGNRVVARRIKIPSAETLSDVRSAFGIDRKTGAFIAEKRPSLAILQDTPLTGLNAHVLGSAVRAIDGVRPREKFLAYAKSMLTWLTAIRTNPASSHQRPGGRRSSRRSRRQRKSRKCGRMQKSFAPAKRVSGSSMSATYLHATKTSAREK